jgi:hypothetical protein
MPMIGELSIPDEPIIPRPKDRYIIIDQYIGRNQYTRYLRSKAIH